jgi:hypothetical protein
MTITYIPNPNMPAGLMDGVIEWDGMMFDGQSFGHLFTSDEIQSLADPSKLVLTPEEIKQLSQGE